MKGSKVGVSTNSPILLYINSFWPLVFQILYSIDSFMVDYSAEYILVFVTLMERDFYQILINLLSFQLY